MEQYSLIDAKAYAKVFTNIEPYMNLSICKQNIANIMKKLYIAQFKEAATTLNHAVDWEKSFLNYLQFFPIDKPFVEFVKAYDKLELLQSIALSSPPFENPIYPKSVLSFLVKKPLSHKG
jgi:hypothetical protein